MSLNPRPERTPFWRQSALRQAAILTAVFLVLLALAGVFSIVGFQRVFEDRIEDELTARFAAVIDEIDDEGLERSDFPLTETERIFLLRPGTDIRFGFHTNLKLDANLRRQDLNNGEWMYLAGPADNGTVLVVGTNLGRRDEFLEVIFSAMVMAGLAAAAMALIFGVFLGVRTQRRMSAITATLQTAAGGDLTTRVSAKRRRDDLDDLAFQVDDTIVQLDALIRQTRDFSANIAHDLKTPLARLRIRLETALTAEVESGDSAEQIGAALEQADEVIAIFDAFLRVAKLEAGTAKAKFAEVDLGAMVTQAAEIYAPVIEDGGRQLMLDINAPAKVQGDRVLLMQMLANLIENAIRYTPPGTELRLVAQGTVLGLADNGPGIPEEELPRVTQPLYRLDKSRAQEGAGLGLALVKTIATVHDARLLLSPPEGGKSGLFVRADFAGKT